MLRRSVVVVSCFFGGCLAGHAFCDAALAAKGFATGLGAWYALMVLAHDRGTLGLDALGTSLLLNQNANPGLRDD